MRGWLWWTGWAVGLFGLALAGAAQARSAQEVLMALKAATGGQAWDAAPTLVAEGHETSFGLTGAYRSAEELASGRFLHEADYGLFANAEGLDAAGRWRMDNSRGVHALDSEEARAVAVTEAFLIRRGYLHPESGEATYVRLSPLQEHHLFYERVQATPTGGRPVTLWIASDPPRLARAVINRAARTEILTFADERPVGGLMLPFALTVDDGDQSQTGEIAIDRYRLGAEPPPARPAPPADAALHPERKPAWLKLDAASGTLLVEARLNGQAPMLFILDTGGHDILTPVAAQTLGLTPVGHGFSLGAGSGSTPTQFVKVARLELGEAELADQPFFVLSLNLGEGVGSDGQMIPISGILGLEVFERFAATLDYARSELRLCGLGSAAAGAGVAIRFSDDMPIAAGELDGLAGWFDLDTGNNVDVILYKPWVTAHGLARRLPPAHDPMMGSGVGGVVAFGRSRAEALSLAGVRLEGPTVLLAGDDMGGLSTRFEAGNVGESVFSRFTASFDYRAERLVLAPSGDRGVCP